MVLHALVRLARNPYVLLSLAALQWGANVVFGRMAVGQIAPMQLILLRWTIVFAVLALCWGRTILGDLRAMAAHSRLLILLGTTGYTGFTAFFYVGAHYTSGANMAIIQGSTPLFVFALAYVLHRRRIGPAQAVGLLLTLTGVAFVALHGRIAVLRALSFNRGDLFMLGAAICYAVYTVWLAARPAVREMSFFAAMAAVAMVTSLPLFAVEALTAPPVWPTWEGWGLTVLIALFPSFLAQICYLRGVAAIGPGRAGVFVNLIPVFGAGLSVLLLGEPFGGYQAVGLVLVLTGIVLTQRRAAP